MKNVLTPDSDKSKDGFFGVINRIALSDYLRLLCMKGATRGVRVSQERSKGLIVVHEGNIIYSSMDKRLGLDALEEILSWSNGSFREVKLKKLPSPNIHRSINSLLPGAEGALRSFDKKQIAPLEIPAHSSRKQPVELSATGSKEIANPPATATSRHKPTQTRLTGDTNTKPQKHHPALRFARWALVGLLPLLVVVMGIRGFDLVDDIRAIASPPETQKIISISPLVQKGGSVEQTLTSQPTTILRLHGSNTVGAQLAPALVKAFLQARPGNPRVEIKRGTHPNESFVESTTGHKIERVEIQAHGSSTGFKDMGNILCDIAMASRPIKKSEASQLLENWGNMNSNANEHVIALDGIAVIVNAANPLTHLSIAKLQQIFSGQITDWHMLGGAPGPIHVYARDDNSGTYDTFKSIILGKKNPLVPSAKRFESNPELSDSVAGDLQGIGFTSLPNIRRSKPLAISDEGTTPILPTFFTVATEDYPISRRLYLYSASVPDKPVIGEFLEFVQSPKGQEVVAQVGNIDLNIRPFPASRIATNSVVHPESLSDYFDAVEHGRRLSLNFRFRSGEAGLDSRAYRDLDRMVTFLKKRPDYSIALAGFTDNDGDYAGNRELARYRAETVASQLGVRGVVVDTILTGGEELPVASNQTSAGREKNRRVEVWLRRTQF